MMHGVIDTLATVRSLEEAGMEARTAEAVTEAIRRAVTEGGATKTDLAELKTGVRADLAQLKAEVRADINELRAEVQAGATELKAEVRADINELRAEVQAGAIELKAEVRADLADFKDEIRADLAALTWRILGGVGLLLAVFTAVDRLLA